MAKKLLGTLDICSNTYRVFEGSSEDTEELEGNHGVCSSIRQEIWIKAGLSESRFRDTLMHEIFHAVLEESGASIATGTAFRRDEGDPDVARWEETFIRIMTPHLLCIFGPAQLQAPKPKPKARKAKP